VRSYFRRNTPEGWAQEVVDFLQRAEGQSAHTHVIVRALKIQPSVWVRIRRHLLTDPRLRLAKPKSTQWVLKEVA